MALFRSTLIGKKLVFSLLLPILLVAVLAGFAVGSIHMERRQASALEGWANQQVRIAQAQAALRAAEAEARGLAVVAMPEGIAMQAALLRQRTAQLEASFRQLEAPASLNVQANIIIERYRSLAALDPDSALTLDGAALRDEDADRLASDIETWAATKQRPVAPAALPQDATHILLAIAGAGLLLSLIIAWLIGRHTIVHPTREVRQALTQLAAGNLELDIPCTSRRDEFGGMGHAIRGLRRQLLQKQRMEEAADTVVADGVAKLKQRDELVTRAQQNSLPLLGGVTTASARTVDAAERVLTGLRTMRAAPDPAKAWAERRGELLSIHEATQLLAQALRTTLAKLEQGHAASFTMLDDALARLAKLEPADGAPEPGKAWLAHADTIRQFGERLHLLGINTAIETARAGNAQPGLSQLADEMRQLSTRASSWSQQALNEAEHHAALTLDHDGIAALRQLLDRAKEALPSGTSLLEQHGAAVQDIERIVRRLSDAVAIAVEEGNLGELAGTAEQLEASARAALTQMQLLDAELRRYFGEARAAA